MKLKHLFTLIAILSTMLVGLTACGDEDYAPITLTNTSETGIQINQNKLVIDAFSKGESFYIYGGNGHYTIDNRNAEIVDYRYDGKTLTFLPVGIGEATVIIGDQAKNSMMLTIEVQNRKVVYKVKGVSAEVTGPEMTLSDAEKLKKQIVEEALVKEGGSFVFTYTDPSLVMGSVNIYAVNAGIPVSGIFRQEQKMSEAGMPYIEFTITLVNNKVHKLGLLNPNADNETDKFLQEDVTESYKGAYPKLERAILTNTVANE